MFGNIGLIRDSRDLKRQMHRDYMSKITQPPPLSAVWGTYEGNCNSTTTSSSSIGNVSSACPVSPISHWTTDDDSSSSSFSVSSPSSSS